jgi:hypothetical protein
MQIIIDVEKHYDWDEYPEGQFPSEEEILALKAKPSEKGKWLKRVVKDVETFTTVNLPEQEIQNCFDHFTRIGAPKSRAKVVAWYLEEKVMPHHAHPDHFVKFTVEHEPEIEAFLNTYFETN